MPSSHLAGHAGHDATTAFHCRECALPREGELGVFEPGELVDGRYRVERRLGAGAMGEVYRAWDVHLKRRVAIKRPHLGGSGAEVRPDVALFAAEAALHARMRSAHVAAIYGFGVARGLPYFSMEHVDGTTLAELLDRHASQKTKLPLARSVSIAREIAGALAEAHALGIVHRDVKPTNVIVEHDTGRVVLVDFGLAMDALSARSSDRVYGTLEYLGPELLAGDRPSPASDQFALGVVVYELLTGRLPFVGPSDVLLRPGREPPPLPSRVGAVTGALDLVVLRALSPDPRARFPTVASFANALRDGALEPAPEPGRRADPSGPVPSAEGAVRVLVVDDDPLFRELAGRCVEIAFGTVPVTISRATSGAHALERCARRLPQLVLLDYRLPDVDGVELLGRIRELPEGRSVRVVVVTAGVDDEAMLDFAALGVRRFARKPLELAQVVELIGDVARTAGWLPAAP